jgi:hypothetical protein
VTRDPPEPRDEDSNPLEYGWALFQFWFSILALVVVFFGLLLGILQW